MEAVPELASELQVVLTKASPKLLHLLQLQRLGKPTPECWKGEFGQSSNLGCERKNVDSMSLSSLNVLCDLQLRSPECLVKGIMGVWCTAVYLMPFDPYTTRSIVHAIRSIIQQV